MKISKKTISINRLLVFCFDQNNSTQLKATVKAVNHLENNILGTGLFLAEINNDLVVIKSDELPLSRVIAIVKTQTGWIKAPDQFVNHVIAYQERKEDLWQPLSLKRGS